MGHYAPFRTTRRATGYFDEITRRGTIMANFWRAKHDDGPVHDDLGEAIAVWLDGIEPDEWPETLEVEGFRKAVVPESFFRDSLLTRALEALDEEFGDPDGGYSAPTPGMIEAEAAFIRAVLKEYLVWTCEKTGEIERVNVAEWVRENRPDWLGVRDPRDKEENQ